LKVGTGNRGVEIFLVKPVGLDLEERKDKTYLCCVFLFLLSISMIQEYNLLFRYKLAFTSSINTGTSTNGPITPTNACGE